MAQTHTRTLTLELRAADNDNRTAPAVISTEHPVDRDGLIEVLKHDSDSIDTSRAPLPLLVTHDARQLNIGNVGDLHVEGRKLRGTVRLGASQRAREIWDDIRAGIIRSLSVGYEWLEWARDGDTVNVTKWRPFEVSLVAVPADPGAGLYRSKGDEMDKETKVEINAEREKARKDEQARIRELQAFADRFPVLKDRARKAIESGESVENFRADALDILDREQARAQSNATTHINLSDREIADFSIVRAIRAMATAAEQHTAPEKYAPFEFEASRTVADKLEREPKGIFIPADVQMGGRWTRAAPMDTTGNADLVPTMHLGGSFIDALRARTVVMAAGARTLGGLVGNVDIPRNDTPATFSWLAEDAQIADGEIGTGTVSLSPKTVAGAVSITRRLIKQSSPEIEGLVRSDLVKGAAVEIDNKALQGSGASNQPTGILNVSGIGTVTIASAGDPTWAEIVEFETDLDASDALGGSLAYIMTPTVRGNAKVKLKDSGSGRFVVEENATNGYPALATSNMPANGILFGNFEDVLIGMWGVLDLQVDPYSSGDRGRVIVRAFQDLDVAVRHAASFSKNA